MVAGGESFEKLVRVQKGLITREQAIAHGFSAHQIKHRCSSGQWSVPFAGVYALAAGELDRLQCLQAVALKCGPGSLISHASAAFVSSFWGFKLPEPTSKYYEDLFKNLQRAPIDVIVPEEARPRPISLVQPVTGRLIPLRVHRSRTAAADAKMIAGIPCTSDARTVCDLAELLQLGLISRNDFVPAFQDAVRRGLWNKLHQRASELRDGRPHFDLVFELLNRHGPDAVNVESELEAICEDVLQNAGLRPVRQFPIRNAAGRVIARGDFAFPEDRFVIEAYGREHHENDPFFNRDKEREFAIQKCGYRLLVVTAVHVRHQHGYILNNTLPYVKSPLRRSA